MMAVHLTELNLIPISACIAAGFEGEPGAGEGDHSQFGRGQIHKPEKRRT